MSRAEHSASSRIGQRAASRRRHFLPLFLCLTVTALLGPESDLKGATEIRRVFYYPNSDTSKVWVWLEPQTSPYYLISVEGQDRKTYRITVQDTQSVGGDKRLPLRTVPHGLRASLAGTVRTAADTPDFLRKFVERIGSEQDTESNLEIVQPAEIFYFWHTDTLGKVWIGGFGGASYRLVMHPEPHFTQVAPTEGDQPTLVQQLSRTLPFLVNTRNRPTRQLLQDFAEYLEVRRPDNEFVRPVHPDAVFYFRKIREHQVEVALLSSDSSSIQTALFTKTEGKWSKGDVDLDLRHLGVDVSDKRPLVFSGYSEQRPTRRWTELWHDWVEGGLSLGSRRFLKQRDYIYKDQSGADRWLWLQRLEGPDYAIPRMAPKPIVRTLTKYKTLDVPTLNQNSILLLILLGVAIGSTSFAVGLAVLKTKYRLPFYFWSGQGNGLRSEEKYAKSRTASRNAVSETAVDGSQSRSRMVLKGTDLDLPDTKAETRTESGQNRAFDNNFDDVDGHERKLANRIQALKAELQGCHRIHDQQLSEITHEKEALTRELQDKCDEINTLLTSRREEIDNARLEIRQELIAEQQKETGKLKRRISALEENLSLTQQEHSQTVDRLKKEFEDTLADKSREQAATLRETEVRYKEKIAAEKAERLRLKQQHEENVVRLEEQYKDRMQQYVELSKYVGDYKTWTEQVELLQFRLERAVINFHDREPEAAGRILGMLNYSTSELLRDFRPGTRDYQNTRLAMITNIQILVNSVTKKHPEFHDVLRFMGKSGLLRLSEHPLDVVAEIPDAYANIYYHQLFKQVKESADRAGLHIPKLYFVFTLKEDGQGQNLILKIESPV